MKHTEPERLTQELLNELHCISPYGTDHLPGLGFLGIELEEKRNAANEGVISVAASQVAVRVIHTDEEQMIARSVCRALALG